MKDLIRGPAIRFPDGRIYAGAPHHHLESLHRGPTYPTQGYVTASGRFLTRAEAFQHALTVGQLRNPNFTGLLYDDNLELR